MSRRATTRRAILDHALAAFNRDGVESVGMRDLARDLGLSPGNLTYHVATKEQLLLGLAERQSERTARTQARIARPEGLDGLLDGFRAVFHGQVEFRCLELAVVHLADRYPAMAERYRVAQRERVAAFRESLEHLRARGSLSPGLGPGDVERLVATLSLVGRFWLSAYRLDHRDRPAGEMIEHSLAVLAGALRSSATAKGRAELDRFRRDQRARAPGKRRS